ncbi:MAG: hypothetical protein JWO67_751 [Streptosporangiaceae bacterium]|nr:hypothetical protein [Streptosporangiaceae bacterium]
MAQFKVTAPLVITKKQDGSDLYLYRGAVLPDFVSDDEVKRLSDDGFLEQLDGPKAKASAKDAAAPSN